MSTPFSLCCDIKIRAGLIRTSVVKMHHFTTYLQQLLPAYLHCHSNCVGYMDVVEPFLPYRNATKTFLPIFDLEKIFNSSNQSNQSKYIHYI
jgi:hypothetical protein